MEQTHKITDSVKDFFTHILHGFAIGIAFIIPGFSGGSVAAILGIYEKLISAIADVFKSFRSSIKLILPIAIGMALGIISLLFPLKWALREFPLPTVSLFVGLAIGGMPSITDKVKDRRADFKNLIALILPAVAVISVSFLPLASDKNLLDLSFGGYFLLFLIGILGSAALVVPGISGSMLLLIFGYYNPLVNLATDHLLVGKDVGISILVLGVTGLGIVVGFLAISVIMKLLFKKFPRGTYFAIIGFIVGSIPTIYASTIKEAGLDMSDLSLSPIHIISCALLLILGSAVSYATVIYSRKRVN